jgi:hypothetical protein
LPKFDPALGSLKTAVLTVTFRFRKRAAGYNDGSTDATYTIDGTMNWPDYHASWPGGSAASESLSTTFGPYTLTPGDGSYRFIPPFGFDTGTWLPTPVVKTASVAGGTLSAAGVTGTGSFSVPVVMTRSSTVTDPGDGSYIHAENPECGVDISATYTW